MTSLNFAFAKGSCSLFSQVGLYFVSNSKVDQLSRQQKKKKVELKEEMKRKSYLSFTSQHSNGCFGANLIGLASCVMIDIKHQKKGKFMLKEHF